MKDLMIKHICANAAFHMMIYRGLEINRDSWICGVKRNSQVFLLNEIQVLNSNYKKHLIKLLAHIPLILHEKISPATTSSERPQLGKPRAAFSWGQNIGQEIPLPF